MARTLGSDGHSYERIFDLMAMLSADGGIDLLTPAELTDEWRAKLAVQGGKAKSPAQAASALIAARHVPGRAGNNEKARANQASSLACRYCGWLLTQDGRLHQRVLLLHRWAKAGFKVSAYEGQFYFAPPDARVIDPWQEYVPDNVPEPQRECDGHILMAEAMRTSYADFLARWRSFMKPSEPNR